MKIIALLFQQMFLRFNIGTLIQYKYIENIEKILIQHKYSESTANRKIPKNIQKLEILAFIFRNIFYF